jgi:hypothetical protein
MTKKQLVELCAAYLLPSYGKKAVLKGHLRAFSLDRKRWERYAPTTPHPPSGLSLTCAVCFFFFTLFPPTLSRPTLLSHHSLTPARLSSCPALRRSLAPPSSLATHSRPHDLHDSCTTLFLPRPPTLSRPLPSSLTTRSRPHDVLAHALARLSSCPALRRSLALCLPLSPLAHALTTFSPTHSRLSRPALCPLPSSLTTHSHAHAHTRTHTHT